MAATMPWTGNVDARKVIVQDLNKHVQYLAANIKKLNKLPTSEDIVNDMKNSLWLKMCKPCRIKLFGSSNKDFSAWKEGRTTSHPLEEQEMVEEKRSEVEMLRKIIKEKDKELKRLRYQIIGKSKDGQMKDVENKYQTADIDQVKTERHSKEDSRHPPERTKEGISPPEEQSIDWSTGGTIEKQIELRSISKKDHDILVIDTSQTQRKKMEVLEEEITLSLNEEQWHIVQEVDEKQEAYGKIHEERQECMREATQLQAERQTLQDQTDSLNRTVGDLSSTLKAKEQNIDKLTGELDEKQAAYNGIHEEKKECMTEISQLQTERQTLQDQTNSLNRTVEDLSSTLKAKEQNIDKLTGELAKKDEEISNLTADLEECRRRKKKVVADQQEAYDKIQKEKDECMREVSQLQTERQTLQDQTDNLNRTVEDLSSTLKTKDQNIDKLTREREETHNKFDKIQKENENYVEQILKLQTENQTFQDQRDTPGKTNEEMASNIDGQQQEMERFQNERDKIQKENDRHAIDISQKDQEEQTLQGQTYSLTKTIKEMASVIETQQKEVETLKKSFDETQTELEEVQMENEKNAKDKFQLQSERKSMMDKLFSIKYGMDEMSSTTEGLQQDIAAFLTELVKGDGKPYEESRRFKRKVVVMRLLCTSRSGLGKIMVDMVTKELTRQLGGRQDLRKFEISIVLPNTSKGVSKGPLFVVCLNTMVLKHVPDALEGPKGGKDVYLLVLHQTTRENLSTLRPDSLRNTGSELRQLGGVIDMVFSSESGLFECNINNTAFEQITTVLKKY